MGTLTSQEALSPPSVVHGNEPVSQTIINYAKMNQNRCYRLGKMHLRGSAPGRGVWGHAGAWWGHGQGHRVPGPGQPAGPGAAE